MKGKARIAAEWIGIAAALGVCLWMIFGDTWAAQLKYMRTELSYEVRTDHTMAVDPLSSLGSRLTLSFISHLHTGVAVCTKCFNPKRTRS